MANEFKHKSVGTELTQAEFEAVDGHEADSQAQGDVLYFNGTNWVRLPAGTAGQVLKSGGPGANPSWGAAEGGITFTELLGNDDHVVSSISTWEDWDLSAIVPAGTYAVLVEIHHWCDTNQVSGARKNGSSLERIDATGTPVDECMLFRSLVTEVDANRVIEVYASSTTDIKFSILGYWS